MTDTDQDDSNLSREPITGCEPPYRIERAAVALSRNALRAVAAYGSRKCLDALRMHEVEGEGACTVGIYLDLTTRQADAAINAGRELSGREPV